MWQQKLIELSDQAQNAPSSEAFWDICYQALRDRGIMGVGYGAVPYSRDAQMNGFSNAGFFKHTYPKEWESAVEGNAPEDNDLAIELIIGGQSEIIWDDADTNEKASENQKLQSDLENDIGMRFGASIALDRSAFGQAVSGIGLWVKDVKSEEKFSKYWLQHRDQLYQICHLLDEGLRTKHARLIVSLSPRERDCLTYLAIGLRPVEICWRLGISEKTFEKYIKGAKDKLRALTRDHAVAKALVLNVIQP